MKPTQSASADTTKEEEEICCVRSFLTLAALSGWQVGKEWCSVFMNEWWPDWVVCSQCCEIPFIWHPAPPKLLTTKTQDCQENNDSSGFCLITGTQSGAPTGRLRRKNSSPALQADLWSATAQLGSDVITFGLFVSWSLQESRKHPDTGGIIRIWNVLTWNKLRLILIGQRKTCFLCWFQFSGPKINKLNVLLSL